MIPHFSLASLLDSNQSGYWGDEPGRRDRDVRIVRNGDINEIGVDWSNCPVRSLTASEYRRASLQPDDILITTSGNCGYVAYVDGHIPGDIAGSNFVRILRVGSEVVPQYLYHFMNTDRFRSMLSPFIRGTTLKNLSTKAAFENVRLPVPSIEDQQRIVDVLKRIHAVSGGYKAALKLAHTSIEAVFADMFGDVYNNHHGFPKVQLENLVGKIVDCPHSTPHYSSVPTQYLCVRSSDIQGGCLDTDNTRFVSEDVYETRIQRHRPRPSEVVYTREGGRLGNAAQIPDGLNVCLGQRMMLFSASHGQATNEYVWALLNSPATRHQVDNLTAGAAAPRINISDIRRFQVLHPPFSLQEHFSKVVRQLRKLRERVETGRRCSEELAASFLQQELGNANQTSDRGQ